MDKFFNVLAEEYLSPEKLLMYLYVIMKVLLIILAARLFVGVIRRNIGRQIKKVQRLPADNGRRIKTETLMPMIVNVISYTIWGLAFLVILFEIGIDAAPLLAGAGMIGLAIGIGAQSFVKDILSGFFLLLEDHVSVGDVITIGEHTGTVEKILLRTTQVRKFSGELRIIPNSEMTSFGNYNRGFTRAIVYVEVAYEQNLEEALKVLEEVCSIWAKENVKIAVERPKIQAVTEFGASGVQVRLVAKVAPGMKWQAERDLRRILKKRFDVRNVDIPFPRRYVYSYEQEARDLKIDTENLEILPEPGSPEELKNPSLSSMVFQ